MQCSRCGGENPEGARFCLNCGAALSEPGVSPHEERKVVSVLFADLVGFTQTAEQLDPEDVRAVLAPYHASLRADLERFGGTVEKFIGDAVMAVFGAPAAHEDDAERAVRAALAIRDRITTEGRLHVRVGITTGEALVSLDAHPERGEGMVAGDVVNTAARVQAIAPTDGILVDESTFRVTRRAIDYREVAPVAVKGKREELVLHEVLAARARFGVDLQQNAALPLVGRTREVDLLVGALDRVITEHEPQLVTIVGVPGIGKSRLLTELFRSIEAGDRLVAWRQGRSLPYAEAVSYWALGEIVKAEAGILDTDDVATTERRIAAAVESLGLEAAEGEGLVRALRPLVGLEPLGTGQSDRRGEAFEAWRRYLEALAARRPLVLVFEDLHWADDGLLDFVDHLTDWATGVPLLVVTTARPELLTRRPGWGGGKSNAFTLSVGPLSEIEAGRLVAQLVERDVIPERVRELVLERAQGNPLYAEEFARFVADGGEPTAVPEGIRGLIGARLDLLNRDEKALLQDAAVVGKVFWSGAVSAMGGREPAKAESLLHGLERREFVRRERRSTVASDTEYAFRHILLRDVAYGEIPRARRAEKHLAAARWIESLGRAEDHAELLAQHYLSAIDLARSTQVRLTPDQSDRARTALLDAGDRAGGLNAFGSAARLYAVTIDLGEPGAEPEPDLLLRYGRALRIAEEGGDDLLQRAEAGFMKAGQADRAAEAAALLAELAWYRGDGDQTQAHLARAAALVAGAPITPSAAFALGTAARFQALSGRYVEAIETARAAIAAASQLDLPNVRVSALTSLGTALFFLRAPDGVAELEQAVEEARREHLQDLPRALNNLGVTMERLGDMRRSRLLLAEASESARALGNKAMERFATVNSDITPYDDGRWDDFLQRMEPFLASVESSGHVVASTPLARRAMVRHARGDTAGALADFQRSQDLEAAIGDMSQPPSRMLFVGAWIASLDGRVGESNRVIDQLVEVFVREPREYVPEFPALLVLADRTRDAGRIAEVAMFWWSDLMAFTSQGRLDDALDLLERMDFLTSAAMLRFAIVLRAARDNTGSDISAYVQPARDFFRKAGASRYLADLERAVTHMREAKSAARR